MSEDRYEVEGVVGKIMTRDGTGKRGPWTAYSIHIEDNESPSEKGWYSNRFDEPACKEGDTVSFIAVPSSNGNFWDIEEDSLTVTVKGKPAKGSSKSKPVAQASGKSKPKPAVKKDAEAMDTNQRIGWSAATERAIAFVKVAIDAGALVLPKKPADAFAALEAAVDKQSVKFFNDQFSGRQLDRHEDPGEIADAKAEAEADDSDDESEDE